MSEVEPIIYMYILISFFLSFFVSFSILFLSFSFPFPSKMVKTNQRRKQDKTRSTQKKMPGPEVQQLHNVGPPGARWRVPTSFSFCTCPLYFAWVFLSYLMPPHFIGIFSLGPSILFYFLRCLTPPPWQQTRVMYYYYHSQHCLVPELSDIMNTIFHMSIHLGCRHVCFTQNDCPSGARNALIISSS